VFKFKCVCHAYLEYAEDEMNLMKFVRWLEVHSGDAFYIIEGKKPNLSIAQQIKRRG
jgi:hypothetical protein